MGHGSGALALGHPDWGHTAAPTGGVPRLLGKICDLQGIGSEYTPMNSPILVTTRNF